MRTHSKMAFVLCALLCAALGSAHAEPAFYGRGAAAADGQGNARAASTRAFNTDKFQGGQRRSFQRNSDGTASAERTTTATNKDTGVTYSGSTTWEKGSGVSREASCKDASGNTVTCGSSR